MSLFLFPLLVTLLKLVNGLKSLSLFLLYHYVKQYFFFLNTTECFFLDTTERFCILPARGLVGCRSHPWTG